MNQKFILIKIFTSHVSTDSDGRDVDVVLVQMKMVVIVVGGDGLGCDDKSGG